MNTPTLQKRLKNVLGFKPKKMELYQKALSHRSHFPDTESNNERLEYLGDAILDAVVGDFLYKKYPTQPEGYLTEMRSKIVNRHSLNGAGIRMGLRELTLYDRGSTGLRKSGIFGNTLEAVIGAIYLDKGYKGASKFIINQLLANYIDVEALEEEELNHKNKLYTWASRNGHDLEFELKDDHLEDGRHLFTMVTLIDGKVVGKGKAFSKKDAGQHAAKDTLEKIVLQDA